jgi:hypothetical protein
VEKVSLLERCNRSTVQAASHGEIIALRVHAAKAYIQVLSPFCLYSTDRSLPAMGASDAASTQENGVESAQP